MANVCSIHRSQLLLRMLDNYVLSTACILSSRNVVSFRIVVSNLTHIIEKSKCNRPPVFLRSQHSSHQNFKINNIICREHFAGITSSTETLYFAMQTDI